MRYKLFEEHSEVEQIENYIYENWEMLYQKSRTEEGYYIDGYNVHVMGEEWTSECIYEYLTDIGDEDMRERYGEYESCVQDAINAAMDSDGWDGYVLIPPNIAGEEFGITIYYRKLKDN